MSLLLFLAQGASAPAPAGAQAPAWLVFLRDFGPFIVIGLFLMFFMGGSKRKQERERKILLDGLKKGDQVRLIGGEFGTVADVRGTKVLIKVDETSNTKILYAREAVASVEKEEVK